MEYTFPGQKVVWNQTEGGGGGAGHATNRKRQHPATVLRVGKAGRDQIQAQVHGATRKTWVYRKNLEPAPTEGT